MPRGAWLAGALCLIRLEIDRLDPYHGAAAIIMTAGSLGMLLWTLLGFGSSWAGLLAGALPTFLFALLLHSKKA
jgi:hypothetical protein